jgi:hypothetical protein
VLLHGGELLLAVAIVVVLVFVRGTDLLLAVALPLAAAFALVCYLDARR